MSLVTLSCVFSIFLDYFYTDLSLIGKHRIVYFMNIFVIMSVILLELANFVECD